MISMLAGAQGEQVALFAVVVLETVFPPLAGPALPIAGVRAAEGSTSIGATVAIATLASTVGALILYHCASAIGAQRLRRVLLRHGSWSKMNAEHFDRAEQWFGRHADAAVFLGRCVPVLRSLVSIPAGLERMNWGRFTVLTASGNLIWCTAMVLGGAAMGDRIPVLQRWFGVAALVIVVLWSSVLAFALWRRLRHGRLQPVSSEVESPPRL